MPLPPLTTLLSPCLHCFNNIYGCPDKLGRSEITILVLERPTTPDCGLITRATAAEEGSPCPSLLGALGRTDFQVAIFFLLLGSFIQSPREHRISLSVYQDGF